MWYPISIIILFLFITAVISLGLGISINSNDMKLIRRATFKNFRVLCVVVLVICFLALLFT